MPTSSIFIHVGVEQMGCRDGEASGGGDPQSATDVD